MKGTMKKRFWAPIWKCDKIEAALEQLEKDGWRLESISGFRKFTFLKADSGFSSYFITCSLAKEHGMAFTECLLEKQFKATKIKGSFIEGLKTISVFRIAHDADLTQRKVYRNRYFCHLVLQYFLISLFFSILPAIGIAVSYVWGKRPDFDIIHIIYTFISSVGILSALYYLSGWIYLQKQYCKYVTQNDV